MCLTDNAIDSIITNQEKKIHNYHNLNSCDISTLYILTILLYHIDKYL
jgi:hypothetical protein